MHLYCRKTCHTSFLHHICIRLNRKLLARTKQGSIPIIHRVFWKSVFWGGSQNIFSKVNITLKCNLHLDWQLHLGPAVVQNKLFHKGLGVWHRQQNHGSTVYVKKKMCFICKKYVKLKKKENIFLKNGQFNIKVVVLFGRI